MKYSLTNELKRCLAAEMSDTYISRYLQVDAAVVERARNGDFPVENLDGPKKTRQKQPPAPHIEVQPAPALTPEPKLVPVTRPFPVLTDDMTDGDRIITLTKHGLSARKIQKYLKTPLTIRVITSHATRVLGPRRRANNSSANLITASFMPYVQWCLEQIGKDKYTCELCLEPVPKGCIVHHTKYEGATIYDLMYICGSCNLARENVGLT